jgi:hypothetical protein
MRRAAFALVVGLALLAAPEAMAEDPVVVDPEAVVAPAAEDTPTPEPTATVTPAPTAEQPPTGEGERALPPAVRARGNNAAQQGREAKQEEARARCVANPSRLLAAGGSERTDDDRSWAWLPFLIAAVCTALVAVAFTLRRHRAAGAAGQAPPSLLEVVATIVGICAGVAGLAAQFVPGVGVEKAPAPAAAMEVRAINARVTRGEFARRIGATPARSQLDRREVGNVIWLQLKLAGYRGQALQLKWGSYETKLGAPLVAATTHDAPIRVSDDSHEQTLFQPIWVGYPSLKRFHVQFQLLQHGQVRELVRTGPMRGDIPRYACDRD